MKNYLKMIPVVVGLVFATLSSVNEVKASTTLEDAPVYGYCASGSHVCSITPEGTVIYGCWREDSISDAIR